MDEGNSWGLAGPDSLLPPSSPDPGLYSLLAFLGLRRSTPSAAAKSSSAVSSHFSDRSVSVGTRKPVGYQLLGSRSRASVSRPSAIGAEGLQHPLGGTDQLEFQSGDKLGSDLA